MVGGGGGGELRAILNEGRKSRVQWTRATLLAFRWGSKTKSGKLRLNLHDIILKGKSIGSNPPQKKKSSKERELMSWRSKMQARVQKSWSNSKDSTSLQMSPKLVPRNWALGPPILKCFAPKSQHFVFLVALSDHDSCLFSMSIIGTRSWYLVTYITKYHKVFGEQT
jgi:hypothetical protein